MRGAMVAASTVTLLACGARAAALDAWPVAIENRSGAPLECHAIAGHWYGFDLGVVAHGGSITVGLSLQPQDGTLSLPNSLHRPVAIQMIYCGAPGEAWDTRAVVDLRGLVDRDRHTSRCTRTAGKLDCR